MGNLSQIMSSAGIPVRVNTPAWMMDHHFQGRPVLPAVETMEALARSARAVRPDARVNHMSGIRFDKFLYLDPDQCRLDAIAELQPSQKNEGCFQARLITRTRAPKAAITRTKVHAELAFSQSIPSPVGWPTDVAVVPEGICIKVSPERLYEELVPFGPAYRNIAAAVWISPDGALTRIRTPDISRDACLGSPFALDAAMHAACAWGQHYHGFVPFPVAMERRAVLRPTQPGDDYFARVLPRSAMEDLLVVDIELRDSQGSLCEFARGVRMRDVSGGRLRPPQWIVRGAAPHPLEEIGRHILGLTVVELDAAAPFADQALTPREKERWEKMGPRRRKGYMAARLALKRLFRQCRDREFAVPAQEIETVRKAPPLPSCCAPEFSDGPELHCSVSHDKRLAVAAAHTGNVGVDVEEIANKALKSHNIYMDEKEMQLVRQSPLEDSEAALRAWSVKEAAAKACGIVLAEAWQAVRITDIGDIESRFELRGKKATANHAVVADHVVTLVTDD